MTRESPRWRCCGRPQRIAKQQLLVAELKTRLRAGGALVLLQLVLADLDELPLLADLRSVGECTSSTEASTFKPH